MAPTTTEFAPVTFNGVPLTEAEIDRIEVEAEDVDGIRFLVGRRVRRIHQDGSFIEGTLQSVYVTDGLAANVIGDNGDFSLGPIYGDRIEEVA